jgi:hypothetical protein
MLLIHIRLVLFSNERPGTTVRPAFGKAVTNINGVAGVLLDRLIGELYRRSGAGC